MTPHDPMDWARAAQAPDDTPPAEGRWEPLPRTDLPRRYLRSGDLLLCREACEVTTVLGSCVAVTFRHLPTGFSGICHAMLPAPRAQVDEAALCGMLRWKYVRFAVAELIECIAPAPAERRNVEVKLFGGGHVLNPARRESGRRSVGAVNVAHARRLLGEAGLVIAASDVGGAFGRKVVFNTATGAVHVKRIAGLELRAVVAT